MADDLDSVRTAVNTHLIECSRNYAELHAITETQNAKIDGLANNVETLTKVIIGSVGWFVVTLTAVSGFLIKFLFF